jgi:ribulose-phosphate 3-epimerase
MEIIPTLLEKDLALAENRFSQIKNLSSWIQVDVTDNVYVPGKSFELELISKFGQTYSTLWDIHLMVKEPINWIKKCLFIDATRIYGQVEMMSDREKFVTEAKNSGLEVGLAFNINTPVDNIPAECDLILLMGRSAGFGSFPLDEKIYQKIIDAKKFGKKLALDGGVSQENFSKLKSSGLDIIYSGQNYLELINEKTN